MDKTLVAQLTQLSQGGLLSDSESENDSELLQEHFSGSDSLEDEIEYKQGIYNCIVVRQK